MKKSDNVIHLQGISTTNFSYEFNLKHSVKLIRIKRRCVELYEQTKYQGAKRPEAV